MLLACVHGVAWAWWVSDGTGAAPATDAAEETAAPVARTPDYVAGEFLVRFRAEVGPARQRILLAGSGGPRLQAYRRFAERAVTLQRVGQGDWTTQLAVVRLEDSSQMAAALEYYRQLPEVQYAEPNYRLRICRGDAPAVFSDDFEFPRQWHLENTGQKEGLVGADIRGPAAWHLTTGDTEAPVAIVDTGIDYYHPDLEANIWVNLGEEAGNGLDDDGNGYVDDVHGYDFVSDDSDPMDDQLHGTHVAGIVGAVGNNGIGVAGVCWQTRLMALKAFDEHGEATIARVVEALRYAVANGARLVNASWSSSERSLALAEAVDAARDRGVLVVAAAGNERTDTPVYPAAYGGVVAVAASTPRDQRAGFSNYGAYVDLTAPGENVYSTVPNHRYDYLSGTSMAAPLVTGAAALVLARHPQFSPTDLENVLRNAVDRIDVDRYIGTGRLNAYKAVRVQAPLPTARLRLPEVVSGRIDLEGTARSEHFAAYALEYGTGIYPTNWTEFHRADQPVAEGHLLRDFSTALLNDGAYAIRLTVFDTLGQSAFDTAAITVRNVVISAPRDNDVLRAGTQVAIAGTVFGPGRVYRLEYGVGWKPSTWSRAGIELENQGQLEVLGGRLGTWDTAGLSPGQLYALRLTATAAGQAVGEWRSSLIFLDAQLRPGWPQYLPTRGDYHTNDWREVTVADLDQDGRQEILRVDPDTSGRQPARLLVFEHDGRLLWEQPLDAGEPYSDLPVVGDVDGDGRLEIFVDAGDRRRLFGFRSDGSTLPGWPVTLEAGGWAKVLADLDRDGRLELIAVNQLPLRRAGRDWRQLLVLDAAGTLRQSWSLGACQPGLDAPRQFPAVGNLDDDPELEIVAVTGCSELACFKLARPLDPLWRVSTEGTLIGSPVVADLDQDGRDEAIIGAYDPAAGSRGGTQGGVYAFGPEGHRRPGWPVLIGESFAATPAVGDLDNDGRLEVVLPSWTSQTLHVLRADGFSAPGWPVGPFGATGLKSQPVLGDVDGDGAIDVVLLSPGQWLVTAVSGDLSTIGGLRAWSAAGRPIDLDPASPLSLLVMESASGSSRLKNSAPVLTDLDGDGRLDVVATSIDDRAYSPESPRSVAKNRYSLYTWALDAPAAAPRLSWPMFQHDAQHTGYLAPPPHIDQPPVVLRLPDQTIRAGAAFFPIELDGYVQDADTPLSQIRWTVEGQEALRVELTPHRVLQVSPPDATWTGTETLRFRARDPSGLFDETTATYSVRADYEPPLANPDAAEGQEDEPVVLDLLANDVHPRGWPLELLNLSRPGSGRLELLGGGRVRYHPKPDFYGIDAFTYTASDGAGGLALARALVTVEPVQDPPAPAPDYAITDEDTAVTIEVLGNDIDADGDRLELVSYTQPAQGTLVRTPAQTFEYTPRLDWSGRDAFSYAVTDGYHLATNAPVEILVKPVNDPPVAHPQAFRLNRNTKQEITFLATDADGDELTFKVIDAPQRGELWNYPKVATYYPERGYVGSDRFTYQASDGRTVSAIVSVELDVLERNNPPVAEEQTLVTKIDQPLALTLRATDVDEDPLTFEVTRPPARGALEGGGTNYTYTPAPGFLGEDSFWFRAHDGQDPSPEARVTVKVTDQNTAPVAVDFTVEVRVNSPTNITLQAQDPEGNPLEFTILTNPAHGRLSDLGPTPLYTPDADYLGPDRFQYQASDGEYPSNPATVTLAVILPNRMPTAQNQSLTLPAGTDSPVALEVSDPDGDTLRVAILKGPRFGRVTGAGTNFVYRPNPGFSGVDSFTYKAWDGTIYSAAVRVTLFVSSLGGEGQLYFEAINPLDTGAVRLSLKVVPDRTLHLEISTNLVEWRPLTSLFPGSATAVVTDPEPPATPNRFYRAWQD